MLNIKHTDPQAGTHGLLHRRRRHKVPMTMASLYINQDPQDVKLRHRVDCKAQLMLKDTYQHRRRCQTNLNFKAV